MNQDEDWETLLSYLPEDWQEKAKELGALRRARGFRNPEALFRTLMLHLARGYSLRETAIRASRGGIADVSDVAVMKRLRGSEEWLRYLASSLIPKKESEELKSLKIPYRLCAVDATHICEPGATGSNWRLHYSLDLLDLSCRSFLLTDVHTAERLQNFPIKPNDLLIADRAYGNAAGINYVLKNKGQIMCRILVANTPLYQNDERFSIIEEASDMKEEEIRSWPVQIKGTKGDVVQGRVCVYRRTKEEFEVAYKKLKASGAKRQKKLREKTIEGAKYIAVFTTVSEKIIPLDHVFNIYRLRWQVELAFKRLKSLTGFGCLPKYDEQSSRAWLYGKLLVGLLAEAMARSPFPP